MTEIKTPDFTDNELWVVRHALNERYGKAVETLGEPSESSNDKPNLSPNFWGD